MAKPNYEFVDLMSYWGPKFIILLKWIP